MVRLLINQVVSMAVREGFEPTNNTAMSFSVPSISRLSHFIKGQKRTIKASFSFQKCSKYSIKTDLAPHHVKLVPFAPHLIDFISFQYDFNAHLTSLNATSEIKDLQNNSGKDFSLISKWVLS